jgi:hypothetical protein
MSMFGLKSLVIIYGLGVHVLLFVAIAKTDFIPRLETKLGLATSNSPIQRAIQHHLWTDDLVPDRAIMFLGDSITQGLATEAISPSSVNYGIDGLNTIELLQAIPSYKSLYRSSLIVVTIGVNDIAQGIDATLSDRYKDIFAALPSDVPLLWNAVMPANAGRMTPPKIQNANQTIKSLCVKRQNCTYINSWDFMADRSGQMKSQLFLPDKIHLSREGYRTWIAVLRQAIKGASTSDAELLTPHDAPR